MADKKADLAGPGIGNYDELKHELPDACARNSTCKWSRSP
jgi:hypothetical protein